MNVPSPVIYIVDDDDGMCLALSSLFRSVGLAVRTFDSAREFLNARFANAPGAGRPAGGSRYSNPIIFVKDGSEQVLVAIRDSRVGVRPEIADRLFSSFFTTNPQGMGMGLSISRSIIEAHGGRLWAVPNDGPGSTFKFAVPAAA